MSEVTLFTEVFYAKSKSNAAITNVCKPAVDRWQSRYATAFADAAKARVLFDRTKKTGDAVLMANAEGELKAAKKELEALGLFKADLMSFTRYYEFMSQIVDYDSTDLEKLSLYARHLAPLLREKTPEDDPIDLSSVELSHYRLSMIGHQDLLLVKDSHQGLEPGSAMGTGKARDKKEEFLSQIIQRLNEVFVTDGLTEKDLLNYAYTVRDKISENASVMAQIENNSPEQALLGDFATALDDAVMDSSEAHQNQMNQVLNNKEVAAGFGRIVFDLLVAQMKARQVEGGP
jgi:type I restriction enzyme R subunit